MDHIIWLSVLGAVRALDYAMVGQFMVSQPLVIGGIFGALLGDLPNGILIGALIQLLWISIMPVGAYVPPDYTVTGGVTVILTLTLVRQYGFHFGTSMILALGMSIPAGILSGKLDIAARHFNVRLDQRAESLAGKYGLTGIAWANLAGLGPAFLRNFLIYLLWLGPGVWLAVKLSGSMPPQVVKGLGLVFWILPALAFAVVLEIIAKDRAHWWIAAVFFSVGLLLLIWPGEIILALAAALAGATAVVCWRRKW